MRCNSQDIWIQRNRLICNDGVTLSVQVGRNLYCIPRDDNGQWDAVEVGFVQDANGNPLEMPESWIEYAETCTTKSDVYSYVPVAVVEEFIAAHGGRKYWT